jgi:hypothetical protein
VIIEGRKEYENRQQIWLSKENRPRPRTTCISHPSEKDIKLEIIKQIQRRRRIKKSSGTADMRKAG